MPSSKLEWFRQGKYDGLCGFYTSLNAMCALFPKLRNGGVDKPYKPGEKLHQIFDEAIDLLSRVGGTNIKTLQGHAERGGIDQFQIEELIQKMARYWGKQVQTLLLHELETRKMTELLAHEQQRGSFALICSESNDSHWVTIFQQEHGKFGLIDPMSKNATSLRSVSGNVGSGTGVLIRAKL